MWDLFKQQPVLVIFPGGEAKVAAAVVSVDGGVVWWNADYLASLGMSKIPGSGFENYFQPGKEVYFPKGDLWVVGSSVSFSLPTKKILGMWEEAKKYIPPMKKLQEEAVLQFGPRRDEI